MPTGSRAGTDATASTPRPLRFGAPWHPDNPSVDERPYTEVFGSYRRAAEDTMDREQIPPPLRDYVKRYFERIRPK